MSLKASQIEAAIQAALTLPTPVAGRVELGDAFALPQGVADGIVARLTGLADLDADLADDTALARWECELVLQKLGPLDSSAATALQSLVTAVHARFAADRTLGGTVQRITLLESNPIEFEKSSGGERPVYSATMRYEMYSNINPQTLGA